MSSAEETLAAAIRAHEAGDLFEAERLYREVLFLQPDHPDAVHLIGLIQFQQGDVDSAERQIRRAIKLQRKQPAYHASLGRVLAAQGHTREAVEAFRTSLRFGSSDAAVHADMAASLLVLGEIDAARSRARLAADLDPELFTAHLVLGRVLEAQGGPAKLEAPAAFEKAVALAPEDAEAQFHAARVRHEAGDVAAARDAYETALRLSPDMVEALVNLGNLEREQLALTDAIRLYRKALKLEPENGVIWGNLGVALQEQGRVEDALRAYDKSLKRAPGNADIQRNRAMALLALGQFEAGWAAYEYRWNTARFEREVRPSMAPVWQGEEVAGRTLLVHAEQGLGDTIQFCRFIPALVERGAKVILQAPAPLVPLLADQGLADQVVVPGSDLPGVDYEVPLMSLPHRLGMAHVTDVPPPPSLNINDDLIVDWTSRLEAWPRPWIGLSWKGSPDHPRDVLRSPGLQVFDGFLDDFPGTVISLQKAGGTEDIQALGWEGRLVDPEEGLHTFLETAALIRALDGVIACDSAVVHLSGTLGCKTALLLPRIPEWRWMVAADTSPWYPSLRLFRQETDQDWLKVIFKSKYMFQE